MINYIVNTAVITALPASSIWDGTKGKKQVNIVTKCNKDLAWLYFPNQKKSKEKIQNQFLAIQDIGYETSQ